MTLRTLALASALCLPASADILPGPLFSGDSGGYNTTGPNVLTDQGVLVVPEGITPVSINATGAVAPGQVIEYVDQWTLVSGTMQSINWWSSGPITFWIDGGLVGIVAEDDTPGPHSGVIDLSAELPGNHYFAALVTEQGGINAFAYGTPAPTAPEPGTVLLFAGALGLVLAVRRWKGART